MIPEFDERGNLPSGIHHATWTEIVTRYATTVHRRELLDGLLDALRSLKIAGCRTAYLDGSFVTAKTTFLDYFQYDNFTERPKGIIAIDLAGLP
ncbi:MAG: DUF6932 family protein [Solirubrobacteraceae bacterium]